MDKFAVCLERLCGGLYVFVGWTCKHNIFFGISAMTTAIFDKMGNTAVISDAVKRDICNGN